jgi:AcrR family transcriptional regulator
MGMDENMIPTKQKILICAVDLFALKGYTETSVRDIAAAVGIKPASLYNHFSSKEDILVSMLNDYANNTKAMFNNPDMASILEENPTADGILACIPQSFSVLEDDYYSKVNRVIYHEQYRNAFIRSFVVKVILDIELYVERVFSELKKLNIIHHDADPDYWKKTASSLLYTFPGRNMLGIGQKEPDFIGMNLLELLRYTFDMALKIYSVRDKQVP